MMTTTTCSQKRKAAESAMLIEKKGDETNFVRIDMRNKKG